MSTSTNIKKSKRQSLVALLLIAALTITGVFAFLTATTDTKENKFTVGNISIEVDEGPWEDALTEDADNDGIPDGDTDQDGIPDYAENIVSGKIMEKAPKIINDGTNEAWAYVLVSIPTATDVDIVNDDGTHVDTEGKPVDLFELYKSNGNGGFEKGINDGWVLLDGATSADPDAEGFRHYVYAYNTEVEKESETTELFDAVRFANVTEEFAGDTNMELIVKVTGLAIQTDTSFGDDYEAAWNALVADNSIADYPVNAVTIEEVSEEASEVTTEETSEVTTEDANA